MKHMKVSGGLLAGALALTLVGCSSTANTPSSSTNAAKPSAATTTGGGGGSYVVVVKATGIGWFDRMAVGVKEWGATNSLDAREEGPATATNEGQVTIVQNLIAQKPLVIGIVPNDLAGMEAVSKQAQDAGIVMVGQEAAGMKNLNVDIEGFENNAYGAQMMDAIGKCTGGKGEYVQFVGSLTNGSHMQWVAAAKKEQLAKFPDMKLVETPIESQESEETAYTKAKEILAKYPNIAAFEGSAGTDVVGIARAVEEAGKDGSTCVMGTSIPSVAGSYLTTGAIDKIFFWDPALAGKAVLEAGKIIAGGGTIKEGTNLGIPGYESLVKVAGYDNVFAGDAGVAVDKTNADQYKF